MDFGNDALTLKQLFERMVACEKEAAEFYDDLSHRFADYEEVAAFWMLMRDDEFNHASILQTLQGKLTGEQLSASVKESVWQKLDSVHQLLGEGSEFSIVTLWDAYEMAHRIETSEVNNIFAFLISEVVSPEDRKHLVQQQVNEHVERLQDFGRKYKEGLQSILAKGMRGKNG